MIDILAGQFANWPDWWIEQNILYNILFNSILISIIHLVFSHCTSIYTLMNCAERRVCEPKAVSSFCRQVRFFSITSFSSNSHIFNAFLDLLQLD